MSDLEITEIDAGHPDATWCLEQYFAELASRFDDGFDAALSSAPTVEEFVRPKGLFLVARRNDEAIGCGGLKLPAASPAEIKRMWLARSARGLGLGRRLLTALEAAARAEGATAIRLETNRALTEAISLYRSAGYVESQPFNDEHYAHHWFEKRL